MKKEAKTLTYNKEKTEEFAKRLFAIRREKKILQEDEKELKAEFKEHVPVKLVNKIIRVVKLKIDMQYEAASEETIEEIEDIIADSIGAIIE